MDTIIYIVPLALSTVVGLTVGIFLGIKGETKMRGEKAWIQTLLLMSTIIVSVIIFKAGHDLTIGPDSKTSIGKLIAGSLLLAFFSTGIVALIGWITGK
jgi:hypothetical protein